MYPTVSELLSNYANVAYGYTKVKLFDKHGNSAEGIAGMLPAGWKDREVAYCKVLKIHPDNMNFLEIMMIVW